MNMNRSLILFFLLVMSFWVYSQKQHIRFERIGTDHGLSQSNVICALQDSRGFMWLGTRDGLNRYDGYKFTVFKNDTRNPSSISNNFIKAIIETKKGDIWVGTKEGVCRFNRETEQFLRYRHTPGDKNSLSDNTVLSVTEDNRGNIWVGTANGLNLFEENKNGFIRFMHNDADKNSLSDNHVRYIFEDSRNDLWICTYKGGLNLFNRNTKNFVRFQHNDSDSRSISNNNIYTMFEDSKGRLWIGTDGGGLNLFLKDKWEFRYFKHDEQNNNSLAGNAVYAINEDNEHRLWIGTENGGLNIFDPAKNLFETYRNDPADHTSLSDNSLYCIYRDRTDNMWIGTFNGGINIVKPDARKFAHYKHVLSRNSLSNNNVLCILEDSKKKIWIGTDGGGLNLFDPETEQFTHFRHEKNNRNSICGDYVLSVCEDGKGNIWVGTWGNGVTMLNPEKKSYTHFRNIPDDPSSLSKNNVWTIFKDSDDRMWIGTFGGGLNLFDPRKNSFIRYQHDDNNKSSLAGNNIQFIYEDRQGKLWVSTDGGGLNLFNKEDQSFTSFRHDDKKNSIINNSVGSLFEDSRGNLWIGTMAGLSCLDKARTIFTNYTTDDGLPNNVISGILEDDNGRLWISSNRGISLFDPVKKVFKNFTASDGLQSNEFKQQAYCKSGDGSMYFGGNNGFNHFFPHEITKKSFDPPLVITGFQVFNKEIAISDSLNKTPLAKSILETKNITLSYKQSVISFQFASLNYIHPEKKQYEYMLEGFDEKWNNIGTRQNVTYTNLDPGNYIFKVRGLNNDGTWSDKITSLELTITPPFWRTWWFKSLIIISIVGCIVGFYRIRLRTITGKKIKLEKLVQKRTAELLEQKEQMKRHVEELDELKRDLEREKYFLDSLMDNLPDAIYFKDRQSRFIRISRSMVVKHMANHPGAKISDMLGKTDFDIQDHAHATEAYNDEQEIIRTGTPKIDYIEKELLPDGAERWITTTKLPLLNNTGEIIGTFGISKDITRMRMLEKEQHDAMLEKAVAQGKFEIASDVMHDIGNAVVGFGSYLTRIRRLQDPGTPEKLKNLSVFFEEQKTTLVNALGETKTDALIKMLQGLAQAQAFNQEEVSKIINEQLNNISRIEEILNIQRQYINGHEGQERKPVNIADIINDSFSMTLTSADKAGVSIFTDIAPDLPLIKGDRTKLMQLMLNIIKNSQEAVEKNDHDKTIFLAAKVCDGRLIIQVKDNGHGFDKTAAKKLFTKGFTTKSSSSGLGLYNCRIIAESHDGTIDIESEGEGKGSVTTIKFKLN